MIPYFSRHSEIKEIDFLEGVMIPVNKPVDWTSFDVVAKIRNRIRRGLNIKKIKVGHSGTLDPFATGLLLICTGKATKQLTSLTLEDKVYSGIIRFGGITATYDHTSPVEEEKDISSLTLELIQAEAKQFIGAIDQQVPAFSAIKMDGKRLYELARSGKKVEAPVRKVMIHSFELGTLTSGSASFQVHCEKGTYIRSLAHDLGQSLGCGAYLTSLKREKIGKYDLADAWDMNDLIAEIDRLTEIDQ